MKSRRAEQAVGFSLASMGCKHLKGGCQAKSRGAIQGLGLYCKQRIPHLAVPPDVRDVLEERDDNGEEEHEADGEKEGAGDHQVAVA